MTYFNATIAERAIIWFDRKDFDGHTIKVQMASPSQKRKLLENQQVCNKKTKIEELEKENRRLKEDRICKICMSNEVGIVFLPCGHLISCLNCSPKVKDCPLCRQFIKGKQKTYMS